MGQSTSVLIVDDDSVVREMLASLLELSAFVTDTASTGEEARCKLKRNPPDVVLLDACLPDIQGGELLRSVKQDPELSHIPVVMISGHMLPIDQAWYRDLGAAGCLMKPCTQLGLVHTIGAALGVSPSQPVPANANQRRDARFMERRSDPLRRIAVQLVPKNPKTSGPSLGFAGFLVDLTETAVRIRVRDDSLSHDAPEVGSSYHLTFTFSASCNLSAIGVLNRSVALENEHEHVLFFTHIHPCAIADIRSICREYGQVYPHSGKSAIPVSFA